MNQIKIFAWLLSSCGVISLKTLINLEKDGFFFVFYWGCTVYKEVKHARTHLSKVDNTACAFNRSVFI